jgi:hypothetical protein
LTPREPESAELGGAPAGRDRYCLGLVELSG